jgi:hypothetical protein
VQKWLVVLLAFLGVGLSGPGAQSAGVAVRGEQSKGLLEGIHLGPVPEVLYAQLPTLPRGRGVVVEDVKNDCPLAQRGVRKHDILLSLDGTALRDGMHLARLLAGPGEAPRRLNLFRGGRPQTVTLGPTPVELVAQPKGMLKAGGPPAVSVEAEPLKHGKLKVVFTFYSSNSGKLEQVTCSGSLSEIEQEVRDQGTKKGMPPQVQDLVDVALKRMRVLQAPN